LSDDVALNLYRVTQEALQNIAKYSAASKVVVSLAGADGNISLTIKDDGKGFDPEATNGGLGLISMAERAHLIGGTISIDSKPGAGTSIKLSVPVQKKERKEKASPS
jgi:signal transduction histidine kinase